MANLGQNHLLRCKPAYLGLLFPHSANGNVWQDSIGIVTVGAVHSSPSTLIEAALSSIVGVLIMVVIVHVVALCALNLLVTAGVANTLAVEREAVVHVAQLQTDAGVIGTFDAYRSEVVVVLQCRVAVPIAGVECVNLVYAGCGECRC